MYLFPDCLSDTGSYSQLATRPLSNLMSPIQISTLILDDPLNISLIHTITLMTLHTWSSSSTTAPLHCHKLSQNQSNVSFFSNSRLDLYIKFSFEMKTGNANQKGASSISSRLLV